MQLPIDILLLTANDCEFLSCLSVVNAPYRMTYCEKLSYVFFCDIGGEGKLRYALAKCSKGATTPGGAVVVVRNALEVLRPKTVFNVGFCGSMDKRKTKLGDIVVSAKLIIYASTKVMGDGIQERGVRAPLGKHLPYLIRRAADNWKAPLNDREELDVKVHTDGLFMSGPEVVSNSERLNELSKRFPDAIAIEMEGEGKALT